MNKIILTIVTLIAISCFVTFSHAQKPFTKDQVKQIVGKAALTCVKLHPDPSLGPNDPIVQQCVEEEALAISTLAGYMNLINSRPKGTPADKLMKKITLHCHAVNDLSSSDFTTIYHYSEVVKCIDTKVEKAVKIVEENKKKKEGI